MLSPCLAGTDPFDQALGTMWESLWHQSGTATRLVRWEQRELKVRITGVNLAVRKPQTLQALRDTAAQGGLDVIDVSDTAQPADVSIEIVPDSALSENQPCETRLKFASETKIDSVTMQMRDGDAQRCVFHESMHVMGVRGHPEGQTVLSYFAPHEVHGLMPIDKAMLRAWYSPRVHGGMTPFEVLPVLADELVSLMPDKQAAGQGRDRFLARTVGEMQAFAGGQGDIPDIVRRCGKATDAGMRFGRMEMSYFLGVAFLKGVSVGRDNTQAAQWLRRAADLGSRTAEAALATNVAAAAPRRRS